MNHESGREHPAGSQQGQGKSKARRGGRNKRKKNRQGENGQPQPQLQFQDQSGQSRPGQGPGRRRRRRRGPPGAPEGGGGGGGGRRAREQELRALFEEIQRRTTIDPFERWQIERPGNKLTRVIDLVAPLGRGQRCLIVSPPKAGKTTFLLDVCESLKVNHPEAVVYALLVNERPEEVTHFKRATHATVISSSADMTNEIHVQTTEEAMLQVLQHVIENKDVVLLLDSITRMARAYNNLMGNSGRTLSGGLDSRAMEVPRRVFGAARKLEEGGSLTILGTALIDTNSRMDEVIFQEFKGTGNTEIVLSRQLAEMRIFPAVDIEKSGTRKEELLHGPERTQKVFKMRRAIAGMPPEQAMLAVLDAMDKYGANDELLAALP